MQGLETATSCVEDMDEWLGIFNLKLRHMREDIESVMISQNTVFDVFLLSFHEGHYVFFVIFLFRYETQICIDASSPNVWFSKF